MASVEVREYQTAEGKSPLTEWLEDLRDGATRARIVARLDRLKAKACSATGRPLAAESVN